MGAGECTMMFLVLYMLYQTSTNPREFVQKLSFLISFAYYFAFIFFLLFNTKLLIRIYTTPPLLLCQDQRILVIARQNESFSVLSLVDFLTVFDVVHLLLKFPNLLSDT